MLHSDTDVYALMEQLGDHGLAERILRARQSGCYSTTPPGSQLVGHAAGRLLVAIKAWIAKEESRRGPKGINTAVIQAFHDIGLQKAAALTCRFVVDSVIQNHNNECKVGMLRTGLGRLLVEEMRMTAASKLVPREYGYMAKLLRKRKVKNRTKIRARALGRMMDIAPPGSSIPEWSREVQDRLATMLVLLLVQVSNILERRRVPGRTKKSNWYSVLVLRHDAEDWLAEAEALAREVTPLHLPLLSAPHDWETPYYGGYPVNFVGRRPLMSTANRVQLEAFEKSDCPDVYDAVNILQRTPWRINEWIAGIFRTVIEQRWGDGDTLRIPDWAGEVMPTRPDVEKDDPRYRVWCREFRHACVRRDSNKVRAAQCARILMLTEAYSGGHFYFVHMLDFRGRVYPLGGGLQYQGDDRQRGILEFAFGKPIGTEAGAEWFRVHGANCWGVDKVPFAERITWVDTNHHRILSVARDPLADRWWIEADKPWQFLAWCKEYEGFVRDGLNHYSHLPVGMDGSNNGLQLYSLLLRDEVGGGYTNCTPSEIPQDIYQRVAERVNERMAELRTISADALERKWCGQLLDYWPAGLPRSAVKRPVMTLAYGATRHSCQHYVAEWYHDEVRGKRLDPPPFPDLDAYEAMTFIGRLVWQAIGSAVDAAQGGMRWLRSLSDLCDEQGIPIRWVTPTGLLVRQQYIKGKQIPVTFTLEKPVRLKMWRQDGRSDRQRHRNGIAPNYIHSLDAALMCRTVKSAAVKGVDSFMMIHDSFATHAVDAPVMADTIRQQAVHMFSPNLLAQLREQVIDYLPPDTEVPQEPDLGNLDLRDLLHSKYFFA